MPHGEVRLGKVWTTVLRSWAFMLEASGFQNVILEPVGGTSPGNSRKIQILGSSLVRCCAMLTHVWPFETLCSVAQQAPLPRNSSGKKTGVSSHFILQGTFPAQGLNLGPGLLHWQTVSLPCEPPSKALGPPYTHWIRNDEMGPSISCYWGVTYRSQNSLFLSAHVNDFQ